MAPKHKTDTSGNLYPVHDQNFFKPGHSYPQPMSNFGDYSLKSCCSFEKYTNNKKRSKQQANTSNATNAKTLPPLLRLPTEVTEGIAKFIRRNGPREGMRDFCAFRSTCRDINLKTFREFGETYFSTIAVGFNRASLQRLRDLAQHKNNFGLSLAEFPKYLIVSTHRMLADGDLFQMVEDIDPSSDAYAVARRISLACQLGHRYRGMPGAYNFDLGLDPIVEKYMAALRDQQIITSTKFDVASIAQALVAFPQFAYLTLNSLKRIRGQDDWQKLAGITWGSFVRSGDPNTVYSNTTFAFDRVVQAIAQAQMLCEAKGRSLNLRILGAQSNSHEFDEDTDLRQYISLQDLDIPPSAASSLRNAFSKLESLEIDLNDFVHPENLEKDAEKAKNALTLLLSSPRLKNLHLDIADPGDQLEDGGLHSEARPDHICIGDQMISTIVDTLQSSSLKSLELYSNVFMASKNSIEKLMEKNASTLECLLIDTRVLGAEDVGVMGARELCKETLRVVATCPRLRDFNFGLDDPDAADFTVTGKDAVSARLQKMIAGPTGPAHDDVWNEDAHLYGG